MGKHGKLAVVYIRVSTEEQTENPLNLANQEKRCQNYCQQKNLTVVKVFIDPGESARTSARPEFQKMLAFCRTAYSGRSGPVIPLEAGRDSV
jgi:DNA invertase Pin-like site-specific DNA recombinase